MDNESVIHLIRDLIISLRSGPNGPELVTLAIKVLLHLRGIPTPAIPLEVSITAFNLLINDSTIANLEKLNNELTKWGEQLKGAAKVPSNDSSQGAEKGLTPKA